MAYLRGGRTTLIREIETEMNQAAKEHDFERAAHLRNQANTLKELKKSIVFGKEEFMDISKDQALSGLVELLGLNGVPRRIEGYDISHMSGTDTVASMVVFTNGIPDKAEYRKFKMRVPGNDDFAHMREVLMRRFSSKNIMAWGKPDLLLIDGGKGQLSAAQDALEEMDITIPSIGLAKRYETIIKRSEVHGHTVFEEVLLPKSSHIIKLLQRIRDESHRFAVSYHSTLKVKRQTTSLLDNIPGIGPATKKKLIRAFGGSKAVTLASEAEIAKVIGPAKAKVLKKQLS
jgi:excinuclease ABC subunit C